MLKKAQMNKAKD
jgi:hypothetical protein